MMDPSTTSAAASMGGDTCSNNDDEPPHCLELPSFFNEMKKEVEEASQIVNDNDRTAKLKSLQNLYEGRDWLTESHVKEIEDALPQASDIDTANNNQRSVEKFKVHVQRLLPKNRLFASHEQMHQYVRSFCEHWAIQIVHTQKSFRCHYRSRVTNYQKHPDQSKRRKTEIRTSCDCPFEIKYSIPGLARNSTMKDWKPRIFHNAKVTFLEPNHTCTLDTISARVAIGKAGKVSLNLSGMQDIVSNLRVNPRMTPTQLRPFLLKYLPKYKDMNAQFICNFRNKALRWIAINGADELSFQDAKLLVNPTAAEESIGRDSSICSHHVKELLSNLMANSGDIWDVIHLFEQLQDENPSFQYSLKKNEIGKPEAVAWATAEMRRDLIRFGDSMFIDMRKTAVNNLGWNYCGPTIKDGDMKVRVVAECLCYVEDMNMYTWLLRQLEIFEPQYGLNQTRFLFADSLVTDTLLVKLGITESCTLRGDYYHLLNEDWPQFFGDHLWFGQLQPLLEKMITGDVNDWENCYLQARRIVHCNNNHYEYLEGIYKNPQHYANWWLRQHRGNLKLQGSAPAEQNHSSVSVFLGTGSTLCLTENVQKLLDRQVQHNKKRCNDSILLYVRSDLYKSKHNSYQKQADQKAKQHLSFFAYKKFKSAIYDARTLQHHEDDDGIIHCYPANEPLSSESKSWAQGGRCDCEKSHDMGFQCAHELVVDRQFTINKFSKRWWQDRVYESQNVEYAGIVCNSQHEESQQHGYNGQQSNEYNTHDSLVNELPAIDNEKEESMNAGDPFISPRGRFATCMNECKSMMRLIQGDKDLCRAYFSVTQRMMQRVQNGGSLDVIFSTSTTTTRTINSATDPVPGILNPHNHGRAARRLQSRRENRNGNSRRKVAHVTSNISVANSEVEAVVGTSYNKTRTCSFCKSPGHGIGGRCEKIHIWGGKEVPRNSIDDRRLFCRDLSNYNSQLQSNMLPVARASEGIVDSISNTTKGIVIHDRFLDPSASQYDNDPAMLIECTLLIGNGDPSEMYQKRLFLVDAVRTLINGNKNRVVINLITRGKKAAFRPPAPVALLAPPIGMAMYPNNNDIELNGSINNYTPLSQLGYGGVQMSQDIELNGNINNHTSLSQLGYGGVYGMQPTKMNLSQQSHLGYYGGIQWPSQQPCDW